jgi:N-acetylglucosaminyldiphosphoundecaprenol N-acetyl-beta-D-mannosaminyltransferase
VPEKYFVISRTSADGSATRTAALMVAMSAATLPVRAQTTRTVPLLGLRFAALSERETIGYVVDALQARRGGWICTANLDVLRQWRGSPEVRQLVASADLVVADGMPLVWAGALQGSPLPERVAGSSLVLSLTAAAAAVGASVFLLGGNPGTAEAAVNTLRGLGPHVRIAGTLCPPFGFENDPEWLTRIDRSLREAMPDVVYVGLGCPKQERLIVSLRARFPETWFVPCGISFSFLAGEIQRAPVIVQRLGLEWLHRLAQEPKRLFRRYIVHGIPFLLPLLGSALAVRAGLVSGRASWSRKRQGDGARR